MYTYKIYNHSAPITFEGLNLEYCATNDLSAIELGKIYAAKLGWAHYTIVQILDINGNEFRVYVD